MIDLSGADDEVLRRRASGRIRSQRYYARIKALTGGTHPERKLPGYVASKYERKPILRCSHKCGCKELTVIEGSCGFCSIGLCE